MLVAANWKMNLEYAEAHELAWNTDQIAFDHPKVEVGVFPSSLYVGEIARLSLVDGAMVVGAQNCHFERRGAFTGEVSALQLASAGVKWVLLGHSERRQQFGESDQLIAAKMAAALECGLRVLLCVGETKEERTAGETENVIGRQVEAIEALKAQARDHVDVAYEPVWAIGTGVNAEPEMIRETHAFLRARLVAMELNGARVLYGGSVTAENASALARIQGVDGFLVGGSSLDAAAFRRIVEAVAAVA